MATTKKTARDDKKQKAVPKSAQNKPKTREALAEKKEPPRAAQMMQAYGKAKLVKELQEHRAEQKAEERRSEQAQAIDTLSEEAEVTAGAAIEEGIGLLERDLQYLQEWRHAEPPQPLPLAETPPIKEPVYPITPAKPDASRKMPSRQIYCLPASTSTTKTQPVRSTSTGRAIPQADKKALQKRATQRMQEQGKLLFRRKRMQAQRVKLQQRQERAYFTPEPVITEEIYPVAEKSGTPAAPPSRPISYPSSNYASGWTDHSTSILTPKQTSSLSPQDRRRFVMEKRRGAHRYTAEMQVPTSPSGGTSTISSSNYFGESTNLSRMYTADAERKWSSMTVAPSSQARQKLLTAKRDSRHYEAQKPPLHVLSTEERHKMVMEKRQRPAQTSAEPDFPLAPAHLGNVSATEQSLTRANFATASLSAGTTQPSLESGRTVAGKYAARMPTRTRGGMCNLIPAKRSAPSKTILAREKLAQSKLQVRLPKAQTLYLQDGLPSGMAYSPSAQWKENRQARRSRTRQRTAKAG